MSLTRAEQLTTDHNIVEVVETSIVDLLQINSGTCTGNFATNSFSGNSITLSGPVTANYLVVNSGSLSGDFVTNTIHSNTITNTGKVITDHLMANSGTLSGKLTANVLQTNLCVATTNLTSASGTITSFASTSGTFGNLTVSGIPVRIDSAGIGSISAVVQDTNPVLGGNLNGNSKSITSLSSITANTGSFPVSLSVGTLNSNTISNTGNITGDLLVANSGSLTGKITASSGTITNLGGTTSTFTNNFGNAFTGTTISGTTGQFSGTISAQTINASTNLTVSGIPVNIKSTPTETITFNLLTTNSGSIGSWKDMPAAATFLMSNPASCQQKDLSGYTQVRINTTMGGTAGASGARLGLRFRPASSSPSFTTTITEANWPSISVGDVCRVPVSGTNFPFSSGWQSILGTAKQDVFLAVVGSGGDGTIDPIIGTVTIELRV